MLPGRFPSPTPPRDMGPDTLASPFIVRRAPRSPISRVHTPTRPSSAERDFTASKDFCQNPQFAQSDPALHSSLSPPHRSPNSHSPYMASATPKSNQAPKGARRSSEPLRRRPHDSDTAGPDTTPTPRQKRQKVSDSSVNTPNVTQHPRAEREEHSSSNLDQHSSPPSESPQPSGTCSPNEQPAGRTESDTEQTGGSNRVDQRSRLPRKLQTAKDLYHEIRSKLEEDVSDNFRKIGVIYIYCNPEDPKWGYKIGYSARLKLGLRMDEHKHCCGFEPQVVYESKIEFECAMLAEKLIHFDLNDLWYPRICSTQKTVHKEWFHVSKKEALSTVEKWESFMKSERPYDWEWKLKPVWKHILTTRRPKFATDGSLSHKIRRKEWATILSPPTTADYIATYQSNLIKRIKSSFKSYKRIKLLLTEFFWQVIALLYSLGCLARFQSTWHLTAFTVLLCCAGYSVAPHIKLPAGKRAAKGTSKE